jgi:hypothetical protein
MKTLKAICTATVLALALSVTAFAGEISSPGSPTPGNVCASSGTATGDLDTSTGFAYILWDLISMF